MRPRRPRGLIITMSVFATLGMVIGGVLFLSSSWTDSEDDAPAATSAAVATADDETGAPAPKAAGAAPPGARAPEPGAHDVPATGLAGEDRAEPDRTFDTAGDRAGAATTDIEEEPEDEPRGAVAVTAPRRVRDRDRDRAPRRAAAAWLALRVAPADATVLVDGVEERGGSPLRVGPLDPGKHTVEVRAPGYEPVERTVTLGSGKSESLRVELRRKELEPARIVVRSKPSGATVLVDGKVRGRTPLRGLRLPPDRSYELTLSRADHEPWQTMIEPAAGKVLEVDATLAPEPVAKAEPKAKPEPPARDSAEAQRDIRVPFNRAGDAGRGKSLFGRCGSCHGSSAPALSTRRYTQRQWTRYLASRRHSRHAELRPLFSVSELADVKAYLLENAADVARGMAAGVR